MVEEGNQNREMQIMDAWYLKNYTVTEILKYMENHKLIITRNNFDIIKKSMSSKFPGVEQFVRINRSLIKIQFSLPEDYLPIVEPPKKKLIIALELEEEINNYIESMHRDKEELNVIIISNKKNLKDNEVVNFLWLIKNEVGKIKMVCEGENKEEFEATFKDDPIIEIPIDIKLEKKEDTEEEAHEEKCCHEDLGDEANDDDMLGRDLSLK
jgi:hypothetical protein